MLTCLTHFLTEIEKRKRFEVLADFYEIDAEGAGATGKRILGKLDRNGKSQL